MDVEGLPQGGLSCPSVATAKAAPQLAAVPLVTKGPGRRWGSGRAADLGNFGVGVSMGKAAPVWLRND